MISSVLVTLAATASVAWAQSTSQQVAVVEAQYKGSRYDAAYPDGFGIELRGEGLLNVAYGGQALQLASALTAAQTTAVPTITFVPEANAKLNATGTYTLMLADANPLGNAAAQAEGQYRHYLQNGATFASTDGKTWNLNAESGTLVTDYAGPGPAAGEGPHRYAWLLFEETTNFKPQANLTTAASGPGHWFVNQYVSGTGLGDLIGASFFTVENGQASYTIVSTTSVNVATVTGAGSVSSAGVAGATSTTKTSGSPSASSSSTSSSGAGSLNVHGFVASFVGLVAAFVVA